MPQSRAKTADYDRAEYTNVIWCLKPPYRRLLNVLFAVIGLHGSSLITTSLNQIFILGPVCSCKAMIPSVAPFSLFSV